MVSDRTNTGCNGPRRRSIPEGDLIDASVEQLVREKLLVGLDAVVNDFDFTKSGPRLDIKERPHSRWRFLPGSGSAVVCQGKLQIDMSIHPLVQNKGQGRGDENNRSSIRRTPKITLHDGSRWRQIKKVNSMFHRTTPGEIYNTCAFYERLT